ncbi:acetyl esterase/lipase [Kitasatospora sp. MAP12-15]|uniref:alpha/beta hydrolase family protein n=1 Tax=unclassified Kitasatospora TaxID=2633591 RepID=UPI002474B8EE|nr:alpha/beta hydrolase [Kitasatospora sp. MAP12-44]MDH6115099.1 acetyl esterase/lipase [Kitasatospora sp. MAP12-44]
MEDRSVLTRPAPAPDLTLRYGPAADQVADAWPGDGRAAHRPLAVLVHGGFWRPDYDRTHARPMAGALRDAGWTVLSVEYRRCPGQPDLMTADVAAALAALPALLTPHNGSVVLLGHSAGGHLALWSAAAAPTPALAGVIALAPVADLALADQLRLDNGAVADFLGGPAEERPDLDPVRLDTPSVPVVIVHGSEDEVVPPKLADSYLAAHPATRLERVAGAGHFALIDPLSAAWPVLLATLATFGD